jgi:hypothetical protein
MNVKTTDLGFIQINILNNQHKLVNEDEISGTALANELFEQNPDLADGQKSADMA